MAGHRLFVAVPVDEVAQRRIAGLIDGLRRTGADVKWVVPENLHLTLRFLGEVAEGTVGALTSALSASLDGSGLSPFNVRFGGVGAFPSASRARVIWTGVREGGERLAALAELVNRGLENLGYPAEPRPFSPHLTLGRCRSDRNLNDLRQAMEELHQHEGPRVLVRSVVMYSSVLHPTGPVYTPLSTFELQVGGPN